MKTFVNQICLIFLLCGACLFTSCSQNKNDNFEVLILDDAKILSKQTKDWLKNYNYPKGFAFVIQTEKTIPALLTGSTADDLFKKIINQHPQKKIFKDRGVLLVVSENPCLVQVRVGHDFYTQARWGGLTAGKEYLEKQLATVNKDRDGATREMVDWVASSLPKMTELPGYKKWLLQDILQTLCSELDSLSLPSEGFYGRYILKPIATTRVIEQKLFGSWWITYVLVAIFLCLFKKSLAPVVNLLTKNFNPAVGNTIITICSIGSGILLTIPSAASAILLSGARLEDQIALKASGIPWINNFAFDPSLFNKGTSMWIALLIIGLRITNGLASRGWLASLALLQEEQQQKVYEHMEDINPAGAFLLLICSLRADKAISITQEDFSKTPFTYAFLMPLIDDVYAGIMWGLLAFLFLPLAYSLAPAYFWAISIMISIYATVSSFRHQKLPISEESRSYAQTGIWIGSTIAILLIIILIFTSSRQSIPSTINNLMSTQENLITTTKEHVSNQKQVTFENNSTDNVKTSTVEKIRNSNISQPKGSNKKNNKQLLQTIKSESQPLKKSTPLTNEISHETNNDYSNQFIVPLNPILETAESYTAIINPPYVHSYKVPIKQIEKVNGNLVVTLYAKFPPGTTITISPERRLPLINW